MWTFFPWEKKKLLNFIRRGDQIYDMWKSNLRSICIYILCGCPKAKHFRKSIKNTKMKK